MIKRDLYCFKSGKLELSMLDEGLEEEIKEILVQSDSKDQMTYIPLDQEEACASSQEDDQEANFTSHLQPQLIITEEIAHTLKTMSGFLMQPEGVELENIQDVTQEDECISTSERTQENDSIECIPNSLEDEEANVIQEDRVMEASDSKDTDKAMVEVIAHQNESDEAYLNINKEPVSTIQNIQYHINSNTTLQQKVIDDILLSHFGEITAKFPYEKELKQKIENQIYKIRSYK